MPDNLNEQGADIASEGAGEPATLLEGRIQECWNCGNSVNSINFGIRTPRPYYDGGGFRYICRDCVIPCSVCEELAAENDLYPSRLGGAMARVCRSCYRSNNYLNCRHCDTATPETEAIFAVDRDGEPAYLCSACQRQARECPTCDTRYYGRRCSRCTMQIHDYSYRPRVEFFHSERGEAPYYLGFEVEVEAGHGEDEEGNYEHATPPNGIPRWAYCKSDGSLSNGFELVSHPLSPDWIRANRAEVEQALRALREHGLECLSSCGMHVHVSRSGFSGTFHLLKWLELYYRWPRWTLQISERQRENLERWAALGVPEKEIYRKAKVKANLHEDRYTAINLENEHTFEVRIFRGTIDNLSFFKNLQYVEASVEFTRDTSRKRVTPRAFREWLVGQDKKYPDLVKWLRERRVLLDN